MHVRSASLDDAQLITDFNCKLALESEGKRLDPDTVRAGVSALLSDPAHGRYFLAVDGEEIVGQLSITYEWSDWRNGQFWWLQSVYIAETHRRKGVFSMLFEHVLALARTSGGICGLRLYVETDNARAIETYSSRGFQYTAYRVMELPIG